MSNLINGCRVQHFAASEFIRPAFAGGDLIDWSGKLDRRLLILLDALRSAWGSAIRISNGAGTLGRFGGSSRHAVDTWGCVMAADIVPAGIRDDVDAKRFFHLAKALGFGGIGCYPQWNQGVGFHVDSRIQPVNPATWGLVDGKWVEIGEAFEYLASNPRL
jgi:hypothetical protein